MFCSKRYNPENALLILPIENLKRIFPFEILKEISHTKSEFKYDSFNGTFHSSDVISYLFTALIRNSKFINNKKKCVMTFVWVTCVYWHIHGNNFRLSIFELTINLYICACVQGAVNIRIWWNITQEWWKGL